MRKFHVINLARTPRYSPELTPQVQAFFTQLLRVIKDGGHWACNGGVYRIDHKKKTFTLVEMFNDVDMLITNHMVIPEATGYKVIVSKETK